MESFLDSPVGEASGYTTAGGSIILQIATALDLAYVNPIITACTGIAGFIFLVYKINHTRLASKNDKLKEKILQHQINKDTQENANRENQASDRDKFTD